VLVARSWRDIDRDNDRFPLQYSAVVVATLLVSPHALYYEAGLLVLPMILLVDHWRAQLEGAGSTRLLTDRQALILAGLALFGAARSALTSFVPFEPMVAAPIAVGLLVWRELYPAQDAAVPGQATRPRAP